MLGRQRPLPRRGDHIDDAAGRALQQSRRDERAQHDCEKQIARNYAGATEVLCAAGTDTTFFHSLGRPVNWRIARMDAATSPAVPLYHQSATTNDGRQIVITNPNASDVTIVLEVF